MNIIEELTCKQCRQIYDEPVTLNCCGENVCKKHIEQLLLVHNTFACPICDADNKNQSTTTNKTLKNLIERELQNLKIDPNYEYVFTNFKEKVKNIENIHNDPEHKIKEKIGELKRQVQLDKEEAISEINKLAETILTRLNSLEADFIKDCKSKDILDYYSQLIKRMITELNDFEKCLKSLKNVDEDRKKKSNEIENLSSNLDKETDEYENKLFKYKSISYVPMKPEIKNLFGSLNVRNLEIYFLKINFKIFNFSKGKGNKT